MRGNSCPDYFIFSRVFVFISKALLVRKLMKDIYGIVYKTIPFPMGISGLCESPP